MSERAAQVQASIHEVAQLLRTAHHLGPEAQEALADLMDELGKLVNPDAVPSAETAHLAESTAHLARALHERHDEGVLATAKERLQSAAARAEVEAPLAAGLVRRVIDALANLGI